MPNPLCTTGPVFLNLDCLSETSWGTLFCGKRCLPLPLASSPSPIGEAGPPWIQSSQFSRFIPQQIFAAQSRAGRYALYDISYASSVLSHVAGNLMWIRRTILSYSNNDISSSDISFYDISSHDISSSEISEVKVNMNRYFYF